MIIFDTVLVVSVLSSSWTKSLFALLCPRGKETLGSIVSRPGGAVSLSPFCQTAALNLRHVLARYGVVFDVADFPEAVLDAEPFCPAVPFCDAELFCPAVPFCDALFLGGLFCSGPLTQVCHPAYQGHQLVTSPPSRRNGMPQN